jgi:uncharacterized protein (DUF1810 family)
MAATRPYPRQTGRKMPDPFDLDRFVHAQDAGSAYQGAVIEMRDGRKVSHWMWFVFPQIAGLGSSANAKRFAIASMAEASAYLQHPVLGPRLVECATVLVGLPDDDAARIFGGVDAQKLRSSMTLFMRADPDESLFAQVLAKYFEGNSDPATEQRLM